MKKERTWDYKQIKKTEYDDAIDILKIAAKAYKNSDYEALAKAVDAKIYESNMNQLIF